MALQRKPDLQEVLVYSLGGQGSAIPMPTWGVLVYTWCH